MSNLNKMSGTLGTLKKCTEKKATEEDIVQDVYIMIMWNQLVKREC